MHTRTHKHTAAARGYSLLELLCVIAVLGMIINLCGSIFVAGSRMSALGTQTLDRMHGIGEVQEAFREATRQCVAVADRVGDYQTGEHQLVLRAPSVGGAQHFVVLGDLGKNSRFARMELAERDGRLELVDYRDCNQALGTMRFHVDENGRLVTLEVQTKLEKGEPNRNRPTYRFVAATRGVEIRSGEAGTVTLASAKGTAQ